MDRKVFYCDFPVDIAIRRFCVYTSVIAVNQHRSVGLERIANHRSDAAPEFENCVRKRASVRVPLGVVKLQDAPLFRPHLVERNNER